MDLKRIRELAEEHEIVGFSALPDYGVSIEEFYKKTYQLLRDYILDFKMQGDFYWKAKSSTKYLFVGEGVLKTLLLFMGDFLNKELEEAPWGMSVIFVGTFFDINLYYSKDLAEGVAYYGEDVNMSDGSIQSFAFEFEKVH